MRGTSFGARLKFKVKERREGGHEHDGDVIPKIVVGEGPDMPQITEDFRIMLMGMDAADKSVRLQLNWATPLYPVTMYYKPMTSLVWLGTGLMTLGGLIAAVARRRRGVPVAAPLEPAEDMPPSTGFGTNTPIPTA
jgi:hypothetical protein